MRNLTFLIAIAFQIFTVKAQEFKNLNPTEIQPLDFSHKAQSEWTKRDALLKEESYRELSDEESALLEKYPDVFENIWDIVGQGCSWYCGGGPKEVTASSYLQPQGSNNYEPKNAHDLNYKNAWVEGVGGYGIGEYLLYGFTANSPRITKIKVVNGYVKSESSYYNNSRVKKLKMYINDKPYAILNLMDAIAIQVFEVEPIGESDRANLEASDNKPDFKLKFEILDVYKGTKWDDVVISEIFFSGLDVHCFAKGTKIQLADNSTQNIEDLKIGDLVAYMDLKTKHIKSARIEKLENVIHHGLVKYKFESGLEITATQDHPFRIEMNVWASLEPEKSKQYEGFENIAKIKVGDSFLTSNGTDKLISIEFLEGQQETYTISKQSSGDNFIANGLIVGVEKLKDLTKNDW
jgi:hypothetical protein